MWFATSDGLSRYDGSDFKVYRRDPDDPNSLSSNLVRALIVDQSGVPWIGTWGGGLNQYDREKDAFIRYQHDPDDPHSLSNNVIRTVYEDPAGTIWVGTMGGLNKLDREGKQFTRYQHNPDDPNSLSQNTVWSVVIDSTGVLWIGTDGGLNRFDPNTEQFIHYRHDPDDPSSLSHNTVRSICEDGSGNLWLGTMGGLCKFNRERTRFTCYRHDTTDPQTLSNNLVASVYEYRAGKLWVSTWGGGLNQFDRETATFTHYRHDATDPHSLSADTVFQIYEDRQGMLWIATDGGISMLDGRGKPFQHYRSIYYLPNSLSHNAVRSLFAGQAGIVWVGTNGGGFNKFDRHTEAFTHYQHDPADPNSLSNDSVRAIYEDRMGLLWVGTPGYGLNRFDPDTERFTHYRQDAANPRSLSNDSIACIYEDRTGTLWIGTWGGGLNAFDRETGQFTRYQHDPADPHTLSHNQVSIVLEDRAGVLWIGTMGGLSKFDRETKTYTRYQHDPTDPQSLVQDTVTSMYEDRTGVLWIGTTGGLDKFDRKNDQFTHYTTKNGLPSEIIFGILEDEQGRLWLSTTKGLSRFDPRTESFRNYDVSDGLQSDTFLNFSAYSKSQGGEIFFGGSNGFNAFYPVQIVDNPTPPTVLITDFQLANKLVPIGADSILQKSILETDKLVLSHRDRVFSFEFAALNYRAPQKNRYKYRMEGFEKAWNEVDITRRYVTYTNLDPGDYVFKVIGANNDGIWNEEGASIRITVTPPWWETMWFRISMVMVAIWLLAGGFRWRVKTIEARSRELEIQVQTRTQELETANKTALEAKNSAETANRAKSTFLANMSHELRTPLSAILGFARLLTRDSGLNKEQQERLDIINRSGEHLLGMVDDILSLSKIEAGRIELKQDSFDVTLMLQDVGQMMKSRAEGKGLGFTLELEPALPPYLQGDAGKLRQVLINLLGNAVKFTETGDVWLRARSQPVAGDPDMVMLQLEVQDSGPGIPQDRLDEVFDSFAQLDHAQNTDGGSGLGLAISKTLVDMMAGEITAESELGRGSLFTVNIPFQPAEAGAVIPGEAPVEEVTGLLSGQPDWRILVVDDNNENRLLLRDLLFRAGFNIKEAKDGEEAIAKFQEWHPHFIWMDMRMPVMDGYAATRKIRELPGGAEVKIVAVTASVLAEHREDIMASGCEDVVRKPFRDHEIFDAMARHLGVQYLYKERERETGRDQGTKLTPEMLGELPGELLEELRETTLALDREATLQVIERIKAQAPETADGLRTLVMDFQMGRVGELLGEVKD
jgi:signal transduction histidine kinase/streptogramin lyase/DNA-binding response OmpR family regulator